MRDILPMAQTVLPIDAELDDGPLYVAHKKVYPQSVSGTFRRIKWGLMAFCLGVYYLLPFVRWNRGLGAPDDSGCGGKAQTGRGGGLKERTAGDETRHWMVSS